MSKPLLPLLFLILFIYYFTPFRLFPPPVYPAPCKAQFSLFSEKLGKCRIFEGKVFKLENIGLEENLRNDEDEGLVLRGEEEKWKIAMQLEPDWLLADSGELEIRMYRDNKIFKVIKYTPENVDWDSLFIGDEGISLPDESKEHASLSSTQMSVKFESTNNSSKINFRIWEKSEYLTLTSPSTSSKSFVTWFLLHPDLWMILLGLISAFGESILDTSLRSKSHSQIKIPSYLGHILSTIISYAYRILFFFSIFSYLFSKCKGSSLIPSAILIFTITIISLLNFLFFTDSSKAVTRVAQRYLENLKVLNNSTNILLWSLLIAIFMVIHLEVFVTSAGYFIFMGAYIGQIGLKVMGGYAQMTLAKYYVIDSLCCAFIPFVLLKDKIWSDGSYQQWLYFYILVQAIFVCILWLQKKRGARFMMPRKYRRYLYDQYRYILNSNSTDGKDGLNCDYCSGSLTEAVSLSERDSRINCPLLENTYYKMECEHIFHPVCILRHSERNTTCPECSKYLPKNIPV